MAFPPFPSVTLPQERWSPVAWQVQEISWAQVIPELPTLYPVDPTPHTVLMLTLTPSSVTPLHKHFLSHPSSINEPVPLGLHCHDQE